MPRVSAARKAKQQGWAVLTLCLVCAGCGVTQESLAPCAPNVPPEGQVAQASEGQKDSPPIVPHELHRVAQPPYVIEPPDTLLIDAVRLLPRPPYRVEPLDQLGIQIKGTLPEQPIAGIYGVDTEGVVNLGFSYGSVNLQGQTLPDAKATLERYLKGKLNPPYEVTIVLAASRALQQIRGNHLVRPDGTVSLGTYGSVSVEGLTLAEAKEVIEIHLSRFLLNPEISLDVSGYNSKVYYVITDSAGNGEVVIRLPSTGKETVLDAIAFIGGLPAVSNKRRIWIARPAPSETHCVQTLPVDWIGISQLGLTATNYQVLPGDRIYVKGSGFIKADTYIARFIAPLERILGFALLGRTTVGTFAPASGGGANNNSGVGGIGVGR